MKKDQSIGKGIFMLAIAVIAWFALLLQLFIQVENASLNALTVPEAILNFFSYFTVLTNILVAVCFTFVLQAPDTRPGRFFSRPQTQSALTLYIVIVGIVYSVALRNTWNPEGLQLIADRLLHDAVPVLCLLFWIIFIPRRVLEWKDVFPWLRYPLSYLVYALARGIITGWYAYPFLNGPVQGWGKVILNCVFIFLAFMAVGLLLIAINRMMKKGETLKEPES